MSSLTQDPQLLLLLGLTVLLGIALIAIVGLSWRGSRMRVDLEREFRQLQEQSQIELQNRHQAEVAQWEARHQAELAQWQNRYQTDLSQWQAEHQRQLMQVKEEQQQHLAQLKADQLRQLEEVKAEQQLIAKREAEADLKEWRIKQEKLIRKDAVEKSRATTVGKVFEQLVPYIPKFAFNPKDARFLGSPIDLVVFEGLDEGELQRVVLIEIKTGGSQLSTRERQLRDVVKAGKVEWQELRLEEPPEPEPERS